MMTIDELKSELRNGARVVLQVRHAERPKIDPDDPTFGDVLHLTSEGVRTSRLLGEAFAEFADGAGFTASPLTRTRETAELISEGMGVAGAEIPTSDLIGNGSFFYDDPSEVLEVFNDKGFFEACFEYFERGALRGFKDIHAAADALENWLLEKAGNSRFFVAVTHDCFIAAFLAARGHGRFSKENWIRFLDGCAIIVYPDGSRRYELVRAGLSDGICGVRRISAAVFDFGGVMTTSTMPNRVRTSVDRLGIDWKVLADGFARYRRLMDADFMTMDEMYDLIWADAGIEISAEVRDKIVAEDMASFLEGSRNERTLEWMRELKSRGLKIGILSNMSTEMLKRFRKVYADYVALADAMVISGVERMFKPQTRIYNLLASRLGVPTGEICFFDDVESNCEGARRAGWSAIRFEDNAQAERDFAALVGG